MYSTYIYTMCDINRQVPKHPFLWTPQRVTAHLRAKAPTFFHTDWEEILKGEWKKRTPPLSPMEWKEKHAKNTNEDWSEVLMGRRCGRRRRLLFRSGFYLTIQPDGSVKGTKQKDSPYGIVEICSVGAGLVKIAGVETEFFLTIDDSGTLRATDADSEECVFEEVMVKDFYSIYKSYAYSNEHWTVAISNEEGTAHTARCQSPLDSDFDAHSLPEMVPDSQVLPSDEALPETPTSRYIGTEASRLLREETSRLLEKQTELLIDLLNFDAEACLMAEMKEEQTVNIGAFPDNDVDIGPTLSEILRELGTNL